MWSSFVWLLYARLLAGDAQTSHAVPPPFLWARSAGSSGDDFGNGIGVDTNNNAYITGRFVSTISFGTSNLVSAGGTDVFLAKYNSAGLLLWAQRAGGADASANPGDEAYGVAVDPAGNSHIAGLYRGTAAFGTNTLTGSGGYDMFLAKYDPGGNCLWARKAGSAQTEYANAVAVDPTGNVLVAGVYSNSINFGPATLTTAQVSRDMFVAKYDSAGNFLWARSAGGWGTDVAFSVAAVPSGNVLLAGHYNSTNIAFGPIAYESTGAGQDIFLTKYDPAGNVLWARIAGGSDAFDYCYAVASDRAGNLYTTGSFRDAIDIGGVVLTSATASADIFLAKYDPAGNVLWARRAGGSLDDEGYGVAVDGVGAVHVTGYFNSPTFTIDGITLTNAGGSGSADAFIAKFDAAGNLIWAQRGGGSSYDYANALALGPQHHPYQTGVFHDAASFGTNTVRNSGSGRASDDVFIARLDASGIPPAISYITDQVVTEDAPASAIHFTVQSAQTPAAALAASATSANANLVPQQGLILGGSGTDCTLSILPAPNQFGTSLITLTVTDTNGMSASDYFRYTVLPVNDPPTLAAIADVAVLEDCGPWVLQLTNITSGASNELDDLSVTVVSSNPAVLGAVIQYVSPDPVAQLTLTSLSNAFGTVTVTVTVEDHAGSNHLAGQSFQVTISPVNDPPTLDPISDRNLDANAGPQAVGLTGISSGAANENDALVLTARSSDPALIPDPILNYPGAGTTGTLNFTPRADANGSASITVTVNDGGATSSALSRGFLVHIAGMNQPPTISEIADQWMDEDGILAPISFQVMDRETAAIYLVVAAFSDNSDLLPPGSIVLAGSGTDRTIELTPAPDRFGVAIVTLVVRDTASATASTDFQLTVNPVNDPPSLEPIGDVAMDEDAGDFTIGFNGVGTGSPFESDSLSVTARSSNTGLIPDPTVYYTNSAGSGSLVLHPVANESGAAFVTVTVSDGQPSNNIIERAFMVTVRSVNDLPVISAPDTFSLYEDSTSQPLHFTVSDRETAVGDLSVVAESSDPLLLPQTQLILSGTGNDRTLEATPAENLFGTAQIRLIVRDAEGGSVTNSLAVQVIAVNDPPTLDPIPAMDFPAGSGVHTVQLTGITSGAPNENDAVQVTAISSEPALLPHPSVSYTDPSSTATLTFLPPATATGTVTVMVTVKDNGGTAFGGEDTVLRSFSVTVSAPANQTVTNSPLLRIVCAGARSVITWPTNDTDGFVLESRPPNGGALSWVKVPKAPVVIGENWSLSQTIDSGGRLFRLVKGAPGPSLGIRRTGNQIFLSWPTNAVGFGLEASIQGIQTNDWLAVLATPVVVGENFEVTLPASGAIKCFRLASPPREPALALDVVNGQLAFAWAPGGANYVLQMRDDLFGGHWTIVTNTPQISGDFYVVTQSPGNSIQFYRLLRLPDAFEDRLQAQRIGAEILLSWPTNAVDHELQVRVGAAPTALWTNFVITPARVRDQYCLTLPASGDQTLFRLSPLLLTPPLRIEFAGDQLTLSWPTNASAYVLQSSDMLSSIADWSDVTNAPLVMGDRFILNLPTSGAARYFRLQPASMTRPRLAIRLVDGRHILSWPTNLPGFLLRFRDLSAATPGWSNLDTGPGIVGADYVQTNGPSAPAGLYQLYRP